MPTPQEIQAEYYRRTAEHYDAAHAGDAHATGDHAVALQYIRCFLGPLGARSLLDVGSGTGRAIRYFRGAVPGLECRGVEPVQSLIDQAVEKHHLPPGVIQPGRGEALPFADGGFDVVCAIGVLHHTDQPARVVREMCRVARQAVFISDGNRFAQGRRPARWLKLALAVTGLWPLANRLKTFGKGYSITEGDGLAYSYSLYDSQAILAGWAHRFFYVPTAAADARSWLHPLLTGTGLLACAFRQDPFGENES